MADPDSVLAPLAPVLNRAKKEIDVSDEECDSPKEKNSQFEFGFIDASGN